MAAVIHSYVSPTGGRGAQGEEPGAVGTAHGSRSDIVLVTEKAAAHPSSSSLRPPCL